MDRRKKEKKEKKKMKKGGKKTFDPNLFSNGSENRTIGTRWVS